MGITLPFSRRGAAILVGSLMSATAASGQTVEWVRQFGTPGGDTAYAVAVGTGGNVFVGGSTAGTLPDQTSQGNTDAFVVWYDVAGNLVGIRQFGTAGSDEVLAIDTDAAGAVYAAGYAEDETGRDALLVKFDATGVREWVRQFVVTGYSSSSLSGVATDSAGNSYVVGTMSGGAPPLESGSFLAKYNAGGAQVWLRILDTSPSSIPDFYTDVATDDAGHVYVVGLTMTTSSTNDVRITQFDALGTRLWTRAEDTPTVSDFATDVTTDAFGNIYLAGRAFGSGPGILLSFLARYDVAGNQVWLRWLTDFLPAVTDVVTDLTGHVYVSGNQNLAKYNPAGIQVWIREFSLAEVGNILSLDLDVTGDIYVAGGAATPQPDAMVAKVVVPPLTLAGLIADTRTLLASMSLEAGLMRSLDQKLAAASRSAATGNLNATCGTLGAFVNELSAHEGMDLTAAQAAQLRASIDLAIAEAGCA